MADATANGKALKAKGESKLHRVLSKILHDGKLFRRGSTLKLTPSEAKPLGAAVKPINEDEETEAKE